MDIRKDDRAVVSFAKLKRIMPMPNLLDVQLRSFEKLVEQNVDPKEQWDFGLDRVFAEIFPISDVNENFTLEYVTASLGEPKYSVEECIERDMTYAAPLKAKLRLIVWEQLEDGGEKRPGDIIEKEVYLGDLPLLTELGTFIINGAERVVVSQLHRSPGVVFEENIHPNGSKLHSARIIPFRGSWVEFTIDINDICYVHIDKKKKFPATALLRALGYGTDASDLPDPLHLDERGARSSSPGRTRPRSRILEGKVVAEEFVDPETGEILIENGDRDRLKRWQGDPPANSARKKLKIYTTDRAGRGSGRQPHRSRTRSRRTRPTVRKTRCMRSTRCSDRVTRRTSTRLVRRSKARLLQPEALRPRPGWPVQDQPSAWASMHPSHTDGAHQGRLHRYPSFATSSSFNEGRG